MLIRLPALKPAAESTALAADVFAVMRIRKRERKKRKKEEGESEKKKRGRKRRVRDMATEVTQYW